MDAQNSNGRIGLVQALLACLFWGVMPIYFKLLDTVPAMEIVAHRVVWCVPLLLIILWLHKNLTGLREAIIDRKVRHYILLSSAFITANWSIYVWAVHQNHILAASLGYFISPLLSVFLGRTVLKETISRNQWSAIAIAALGVSILAIEAWATFWISLALAGSWVFYSLVRKIASVGPVVGLTMETGILFPFFLGYLLWLSFSGHEITFTQNVTIDLLLVGGAMMTASPLLLFAAAVKKMSLTVMGLSQYVAPTIQFLIGVFIYNEPLSTSHIICFALIWLSLSIFSADSYFGGPKKVNNLDVD